LRSSRWRELTQPPHFLIGDEMKDEKQNVLAELAELT